MSCSKTGVTHFKTTIGGNTIIVALNIETALTLRHAEAFIDKLRQEFGRTANASVVKARIRVTYPNCVFIDDLPSIPTAHNIL
jgi:hypothetical protein